ncbi:hypothetical protein D3C87_1808040 [compost metagenome]
MIQSELAYGPALVDFEAFNFNTIPTPANQGEAEPLDPVLHIVQLITHRCHSHFEIMSQGEQLDRFIFVQE